jgi:hypothetical protein
VTAAEPTPPAANGAFLTVVVDLLLRPGAFFARQPKVRGKATLAIVVVLALEIALSRPDKIDRITTAYGFTRFLASLFVSLFLAGPLYWWLGGLWCLARIRWSGEPAVDRDRASMIFGVSEMVHAVPVIAWAAIDLALSPARPWMSPTLILAAAWSQFVSYQAVRATFPVVSPWRARVWFLIIPGLVYAGAYWRML